LSHSCFSVNSDKRFFFSSVVLMFSTTTKIPLKKLLPTLAYILFFTQKIKLRPLVPPPFFSSFDLDGDLNREVACPSGCFQTPPSSTPPYDHIVIETVPFFNPLFLPLWLNILSPPMFSKRDKCTNFYRLSSPAPFVPAPVSGYKTVLNCLVCPFYLSFLPPLTPLLFPLFWFQTCINISPAPVFLMSSALLLFSRLIVVMHLIPGRFSFSIHPSSVPL